ncbi:MAG: hypothetical protein QXG35_10480 [Nitrososphaerota archaeon]
MVKFILKDGSEFTGEIHRPAGKMLIVSGLLIFSDGVVSNLIHAALNVDEIEEVVSADQLENTMIELARDYQPPEATRPEIRPPPRWLVRFKPPRLPAGYTNPRAVFMAKTPWGEAQAEATTLNLTAGEATVELSAQPLCGYITYERGGRRYKRNLEMTSVQEAV